MSRLTRDGTAEPVSRGQILRHERGQGNIHFFCSADHVQDWQPYPVDPYACYMCAHTYTLWLDYLLIAVLIKLAVVSDFSTTILIEDTCKISAVVHHT